MREKRQARPHVESLESRTLLSGAGAAVAPHHAQVAVVPSGATTSGMTITLSGTERGLFTARQRNPDTGAQYNLIALGRVSPLGPTAATGSFQTPGFILNGTVTGSLTLRARRGTLNLNLTGT